MCLLALNLEQPPGLVSVTLIQVKELAKVLQTRSTTFIIKTTDTDMQHHLRYKSTSRKQNVVDRLFQRGNVTTEKVDEYHDDVMISIPNQYRNWYGRKEDPPFGEVHGVELQTNTGNTIHLQWLAFPTAIAAITAVILLWTIAESRGKRRNRPVWKYHFLPFLFYSHRFKRGENDSKITEESHADVSASIADNERLLETDEMEKLAVKLQVRFQWPGDGDTEAEAMPRRRKGLRDVDVDSLLQ
ncbi:hypothetical protein PG996_010564 [Apiospora saccharicola]|uniref:Uncharacterized protein n=1 Tax=Apiospora saccharicola TaxID=335842 RepID=A0ABR1US15_9PEZI